MDADLRRMLKQIVHVRAPVGDSLGGTPTFGPPIPIRARVEYDAALVLGTGSGVQRDPRQWFVTEYPVTTDMRIFLPGVDPLDLSKGKKPAAVVSHLDENTAAVDHYEVQL